MSRWVAVLIFLAALIWGLWTNFAHAQSGNTYTNPPAGQPGVAHVGITNPPAPVISGAGSTGGTTTYVYSVVAYGHNIGGTISPTLMGATATVTTAINPPTSGSPVVLTTQANPGSVQYDFLKLVGGVWQSICLAVPVPVANFQASGITCSDTGQVPAAYVLPTTNATTDLVANFAALGNVNIPSTQSGPINTAAAQTAKYNGQGFGMGNISCPVSLGDVEVEGCALGATIPAAVNSTSGNLNGTLGKTTPSSVAATTLSASQSTTLNGTIVITGISGSSLVGILVGTAANPVTVVSNNLTLTNVASGVPQCLHAGAAGVVTGTGSDCGAGGGGALPGGSPGSGQYQINATTFGGLSGTGQMKLNGSSAPTIAVAGTDYQAPISTNSGATHNFLTGFTAPNTFTKAQPASTDLSDIPVPTTSGGTQCNSPLLFSALPVTPPQGTTCTVTDSASGCTAATAVTAGSGATKCTVTYLGTSWLPAGGATSAATGGTTNNAAQFSVPYYSAAGTTNTLSGSAVGNALQLDSSSGMPTAYLGTSCTNQVPTALSGAGVATCTTLTSSYVNNSIALTGGDINISSQVISTHISGATNTDLASFNATGNLVNYAGSGPLATHQFGTTISAAGALSGAQPAAGDISAGTFTGSFNFASPPSLSGASITSATIAQSALAGLPVTVANGGTQCTGPTLFAGLPGSPASGTLCIVTDSSQTCSAGTQITSGTGTAATPYCQVMNLGTPGSPLWYAAGANAAGSGSGSNYATVVNTSGTSITASCSILSNGHPGRDMVWQVLTGATTYTTPATGAGCIDGSVIEAYFVQHDNQGYQVTLADGAGTNHTGGGFLTVPTSTGTGQGYFLHVELEYHTNNTQWELKPQITNPLGGSGTATLNYGLALFSNSGVTTSSVCLGRDITNPSATIGFDGYTAGQVTVHGPSTGNPGDTVLINCGGGGGGGGGSGTTAGFSNSPTVVTAGGNATTTLTGQCLSAGCTDIQTIANSSNNGTLTITPENPVGGAGMTPYEYIFVFVNDTGTAPSDILFAAQSGVTYQSLQPGSGANGLNATTFLTGTSATAKLARANSCGSPPVTGQLVYNFIWDGTNLTLTGCSSNVTSSIISPALVGGAQWVTRATANGPGTDSVLASDTVIEDNTTGGNWTETLPACNSTNVGKFYKFKNVGTGNGTIILTPNGADTIDALSSVTVSGSYAEYTIRCSSTSGVWRRELPLPWTHLFGGTDVTSPGTNGQLLTSNGTNFVVASAARPVGFAFPGTIANSQIVSIPCTGTWNFPASMGGAQTFPDATAQATCDGAGPSGSADDFTISVCTGSGSTISCTQKADVSLAATTCAPTFNANAAFACAPGNTLQVAAPGTTHSEVNVAIMLQGHTP